jgi:hypothetical protein
MRGSLVPAINKQIYLLEGASIENRRKFGCINFLALNRQSLLCFQDWLNQYHIYWDYYKETLEN